MIITMTDKLITAKAVPTNISSIKTHRINSAKNLLTTVNADSEGQSGHIRRQSKRLQGISASMSKSELPATIQAMSSKTTPSTPAMVPAEVVQSHPQISNKNMLDKPELDAFSEHDKKDNQNINDFEIEGSTKEDTNQHNGAAKKRKADVHIKEPAKKQYKANNPKPKTAKERFRLAAASDTRPLPWGEPEVWADV